MAHRLDVVAIGIEDEGGIIVGMIVRPQARIAIVSAAGMKCGSVEGIDTRSVAGSDGNV
jgi:hypothetical protein